MSSWDPAAHAALVRRYPQGTKVVVLTRYAGAGHFAPDGCEGTWYVARALMNDLLLSRHHDLALEGNWERAVHLQRIEGAPEAAWRAGRDARIEVAS